MSSVSIRVGELYAAKIGGRTMDVRIERVNPRGGWDAISLGSNKKVRLKKGQSLRELPEAEEPPEEPGQDEAPEAMAAGVPAAAEQTPALAAVAQEPVAATEGLKGKRGRAGKAPDATSSPLPSKGLSCLDAAAAVLRGSGTPMACKALIDAMFCQKLWTSDAPTPAATLSSALQREIKVKGSHSRFCKAERGLFALSDGN